MGCGGSKKAAPEVTGVAPESKVLNDEKTDVEAVAGAPLAFDFTVVVERAASESLGVKVDYPGCKSNSALEVLLVRPEGLIPDWNSKNKDKPDVLVKEGDLIIGVNGVQGDADKMMSEVTAKAVTLLIQRAPETEKAATEAPVLLEPAAEPVATEIAEAKTEEPQAQGDQSNEATEPVVESDVAIVVTPPAEDAQDVTVEEAPKVDDQAAVQVCEPEEGEMGTEAEKKTCAFC